MKLAWSVALVSLVLVLLTVLHASRDMIEMSLLALLPIGAINLLLGDAAPSGALAPLIAVVGCDGSGKSTLAADIRRRLLTDVPVEVCYLGLGTGELGERIKRIPVIGSAVERRLAAKAKQTRTKSERIPGLATAAVVFAFSLLRRRRFRHVLALRRRGVTVITDRYPQTEVAGFYDGPGLSAARAGSPAVAWLAARERRMYEWMAGYHPSAIVRLNVDAATAFARKPDHKLDLLRAKVAVTPTLRFDGAPIFDLDGCAPYADVLREAFQIVSRTVERSRHDLRLAA